MADQLVAVGVVDVAAGAARAGDGGGPVVEVVADTQVCPGQAAGLDVADGVSGVAAGQCTGG